MNEKKIALLSEWFKGLPDRALSFLGLDGSYAVYLVGGLLGVFGVLALLSLRRSIFAKRAQKKTFTPVTSHSSEGVTVVEPEIVETSVLEKQGTINWNDRIKPPKGKVTIPAGFALFLAEQYGHKLMVSEQGDITLSSLEGLIDDGLLAALRESSDAFKTSTARIVKEKDIRNSEAPAPKENIPADNQASRQGKRQDANDDEEDDEREAENDEQTQVVDLPKNSERADKPDRESEQTLRENLRLKQELAETQAKLNAANDEANAKRPKGAKPGGAKNVKRSSEESQPANKNLFEDDTSRAEAKDGGDATEAEAKNLPVKATDTQIGDKQEAPPKSQENIAATNADSPSETVEEKTPTREARRNARQDRYAKPETLQSAAPNDYEFEQSAPKSTSSRRGSRKGASAKLALEFSVSNKALFAGDFVAEQTSDFANFIVPGRIEKYEDFSGGVARFLLVLIEQGHLLANGGEYEIPLVYTSKYESPEKCSDIFINADYFAASCYKMMKPTCNGAKQLVDVSAAKPAFKQDAFIELLLAINEMRNAVATTKKETTLFMASRDNSLHAKWTAVMMSFGTSEQILAKQKCVVVKKDLLAASDVKGLNDAISDLRLNGVYGGVGKIISSKQDIDKEVDDLKLPPSSIITIGELSMFLSGF